MTYTFFKYKMGKLQGTNHFYNIREDVTWQCVLIKLRYWAMLEFSWSVLKLPWELIMEELALSKWEPALLCGVSLGLRWLFFFRLLVSLFIEKVCLYVPTLKYRWYNAVEF
jgi:hypothetical protein